MAKRDSTYQNARVNLLQGGDYISIDSDGYLDFFGYSVTGIQAKNALYDRLQVSAIATGAVSTALSVLNQPKNTKYITISMTSTCISALFWLTSCMAGEEAWIIVRSGSTASGAVYLSTSGCSLVGWRGNALSGLTLNNSIASAPAVHLVCLTTNEWSVIGIRGNVVE